MKFTLPLVHGRLIKRYKRFLANVLLDDGTIVTAHCTNSGSMKSCIEENAEVYLSPATDPKRKTKYTWEMILIEGSWVGVHTTHPNQIVYEAIVNNEIPQLKHYNKVQREVKVKDSRLDIVAMNEDETCFIEVKNASMKQGNSVLFPDAVTSRGKKHLHTLISLKEEGYRAVMVYLIQRVDVDTFGVASDIDPDYSSTLKQAHEAGVEIIPLQARVTPSEISIVRELPYSL
ncbi:DNA/RNA nuclease SfsA [Carboxylicivirga sp. N1Y90]|uniref:DNA/RNA nuclease SfsA n=1 Tax=Carboxylicivirga fragile TaxID=3417571 RepID=UPI003D33D5B6|nr:DNA/RNA nuclease SfsA [Marinilabiliaceae bacterium N1Y90]